ncbi:MAG: hypothetical protein JW384_01836 [Nitrosomonadaceae bacterium]|nr:hypothetical protein [Nitrosomonadaceae bacterium]
MDSESRRFHREELVKPKTLPVEIARKFVEGTLLEDIHPKTKSDKSMIYPLYEGDALVSGIEHVKLFVDYRQYHKLDPDRPNQIRFKYNQIDTQNPDHQKLVAQMHLGIVDARTLSLVHRYVAQEFRIRSGVGTELLQTAEDWVQQVADAAHHPMTIYLQAGQESVIKWVKKMGYSVSADQSGLLEEIELHPERFLQAEAFVSPESRAQGVVKDLYTFRVETQGRYMENAVRLIFKKVFRTSQVVD